MWIKTIPFSEFLLFDFSKDYKPLKSLHKHKINILLIGSLPGAYSDLNRGFADTKEERGGSLFLPC